MGPESEAEMIVRSAVRAAQDKSAEIERAMLVTRHNLAEDITAMRRRDSAERKVHLDVLGQIKSEIFAATAERDAIVAELTLLRAEVAELQAKRDEVRARILNAVSQCR